MLQFAGASRRNHRNEYSFRNASSQIEVVSVLGSVRVHTGEQNFSRTKIGDSPGPFDNVSVCPFPSAVRVDFGVAIVLTPRVDGNDNALAAEALSGFLNERRIVDCRSVQGDLVGP